MAVFQALRENTKIILWITVIAFVGLIFLAWGADFTAHKDKRGPDAGILAKVNDVPMDYREYLNAIQEAQGNYQLRTGQAPDDQVVMAIQSQTWRNMVDRLLIRQEVEERDIQVTDREVAMALVNNPAERFRMSPIFQTEGKFDIQKYQSWVTDSRTNTSALEQEQRELIAHEKLKLTLLSGVPVSSEEVREAWLAENDRCDLDCIIVTYNQMRGDEPIGDPELQSHLEAHANDFRYGERVALEYVTFQKKPSSNDTLDARSEIEEAFQEVRRGDNFTDLVTIYSEAQPARSGGEEAPFLTRQQISQTAVAEAAFTLEVGQTSAILSSADGFHVIKVEEKTVEDEVEKVKIAEIFVPLRMSSETNIAIRDAALDLADSAAVVGFPAAAEARGLNLIETGLFEADAASIPKLFRLAAAKDFAKDCEADEYSRPIETQAAWYLLHAAERRPPEMPTFEEARDRVEAGIRRERGKDAARALASTLLERCQAGTPLEEVAAAESLATFYAAEAVTRFGYIRGVGSDPHLTGAAFASGVGLLPQVIMGLQGALVVEVTARTEPSEEEFAEKRAEIHQRLLREKQTRFLNTWMESVRESAKIEDYRLAVASR
jgi:peptidyl-prolyl cis-trans isomerase D